MKQYEYKNMFSTGKSLQYFLDNPECFVGGEEYLDQCLLDYQIIPVCEMLAMDPSGIDYYLSHGMIDFDPDNIDFTYHTGYWWSTEQGEVKTIQGEPCNTITGECKAKFLCTYPLSEEIEFQADNGELAYQYIGPNFLAVWEKIGEE